MQNLTFFLLLNPKLVSGTLINKTILFIHVSLIQFIETLHYICMIDIQTSESPLIYLKTMNF